jgi:hypothetical protein
LQVCLFDLSHLTEGGGKKENLKSKGIHHGSERPSFGTRYGGPSIFFFFFKSFPTDMSTGRDGKRQMS